jgi:hypothetical protein
MMNKPKQQHLDCIPRKPPAPREAPASRRARRPLRCLECGVEEVWPAPGWYKLERCLLRSGVPPEILNRAERRAWAGEVVRWKGCFCSLKCLARSLDRFQRAP